jgi:hypothetical protein
MQSMLSYARVVKMKGVIVVGSVTWAFSEAASFWRQIAVSFSSSWEYEIPCPSRFSIRIISTFPVRVFTAFGRRRCLGGAFFCHLTQHKPCPG